MNQYRVELRVENFHSKAIDVMANSHEQAKMRAERQIGYVVLSTEFVG